MKKKVIDLRDCKEEVEIIVPQNSTYSYFKDWTVTIHPPKDPFDLVPKSWEEYVGNNEITEYDIIGCDSSFFDTQYYAIKEDAEAFLALIQLRRLWHEWVKVLGEPFLDDSHAVNYTIYYFEKHDRFGVNSCFKNAGMLVFREQSHAEKFIECFGKLLEKAKILL